MPTNVHLERTLNFPGFGVVMKTLWWQDTVFYLFSGVHLCIFRKDSSLTCFKKCFLRFLATGSSCVNLNFEGSERFFLFFYFSVFVWPGCFQQSGKHMPTRPFPTAASQQSLCPVLPPATVVKWYHRLNGAEALPLARDLGLEMHDADTADSTKRPKNRRRSSPGQADRPHQEAEMTDLGDLLGY